MANTDLGSVATSLIPKFDANIIIYILISVLALGGIGFGFYILFKKKKYNLSFVIYQDINGKPTIIDRVKGTQISIGLSGEKVFYIPKYKKYLPIGNIQMGHRIYWYYIDKAGHWHNYGIDYIDVKKREPQLNMQLEMDYARDGINKDLIQRHEKPNFWAKWGTIIISIVVITIMLVFIWLAFKDALQSSENGQANLIAMNKLNDNILSKYQNLLVAMDNVCSGHSIDVPSLLNDSGSANLNITHS